MARKSIQELVAQADATIEDNTTGNVTPADVRELIKDFLNAVRPAYGYLSKPGASPQVFGLTAVKLAWTTGFDSDATETTSNATNGSIARTERGACTITFNADIEAAANRFITFTLYKDGLATPWRITGNGAGSGNPVAVGFTAIDYADPAATYEIWATAEINGVTVNVGNAALVLQVLPVNSYV